MNLLVEIMGWAGAIAVLGGYLLLSMKKLRSDTYIYHGLNIFGSLTLGLYAIYKNASASFAVNSLWLLIGIFAVISLYRSKRSLPG